jgi:acyl-CoA synthetase (AMP-forming)/AMP-acid ligase II
LEASRASIMITVPTMLSSLTAHPMFGMRRLSSLRVVIVGGAPVPASLVRTVEEALDVTVVILYGQTELSPVLAMTSPNDSLEDRTATVGRPLPGVECQVARIGTDLTMPTGEAGEICARGYQVMAGYDGDPAATAEVVGQAGFLRTGDLGSMDERGYIRVTGRLRETIIRGGENIDPVEIEKVIAEDPFIAECAVLGVQDAHYGELVAAVLVLRADAASVDVASLLNRCGASLATHKLPQLWFTSPGLPMTASGKVRRVELRDAIEKGELQALPMVNRGAAAGS